MNSLEEALKELDKKFAITKIISSNKKSSMITRLNLEKLPAFIVKVWKAAEKRTKEKIENEWIDRMVKEAFNEGLRTGNIKVEESTPFG